MTNIKTTCFWLQIFSVGWEELMLTVPRHCRGGVGGHALAGSGSLIGFLQLGNPCREPCDCLRLVTSNIKCSNLEEVLWVGVF